MGKRLTKIYTRTGDRGETGLARGERVAKDCARIEAIGTIDELNSHLGVLLAEALADKVRAVLTDVQHRLFDLGGELSLPDLALLRAEHVEQLETLLDEFNATLPPLKEFILPGGDRATAQCHVARTVCRRAERRLVTLAADESVNPQAIAYVNRLSDLLFVLCRTLMRSAEREEVLWASENLGNNH
ncbi:MAG TPA: cob(I)yrinic acid a,c-diamide adenosyltransferase [Gammaproteobacteria bacterium]